MENLVQESSADQGNEVCAADNAVLAAPPKKSILTFPKGGNAKAKAVDAAKPETDGVIDLIQEIENLEKADAIERLGELEEGHEKTYFEIGGVLSVIQKNKWFDTCASFDEWVENNTAMKRSKAHALTQIYDAIANSGVTWAMVKHLGWTKLRAIARVLTKDNADHWIGIASKNSKIGIRGLVKKHLAASGGAVVGGSTATHVKTFKFHDDQVKTIDAAIEKAKATSGTSVDSATLEYICLDYIGGQTLQERLAVLGPEVLAKTFADVLNALGKDAATAVIKSVHQNVTHEIDL